MYSSSFRIETRASMLVCIICCAFHASDPNFSLYYFEILFSCVQGPKLLASFCCGCKEGDDSSAMDENTSESDFQNFRIILQGLADCVASCGGGLLVSLPRKILILSI